MPRNLTVLETKSRSILLSATSSPPSLAVSDGVAMPTSNELDGLDMTSWSVTVQSVSGHSMGPATSMKFAMGMQHI